MDNKLSELKAAAMAATPGPWSWKLDGIFYYLSPEGVNNPLFRIIDDGSAWGEYAETIEHDGPDARFIAAANPAVVLALLAELEAKDKRIIELEAKLSEMTTFRDNAVSKNARRWEEILELRAKLATPVRPPKKDDLSLAGCNATRLAINFRNSAIDEYADAIRAAGFTVAEDA